jgi:RNA polymerase sigma-70 factor (ECF subfamily)
MMHDDDPATSCSLPTDAQSGRGGANPPAPADGGTPGGGSVASVDPLPGSLAAGLSSPDVRSRLVRLAYRLLWRFDDAEDAVQDALAVAYRRRDSLDDPEKWWGWLVRIVVNRCHEHARRERVQRRHVMAQGTRVEREAVEPPAAEPDEATRRLPELLARLPRRQREVIVLRHLEQMSFEEIGVVLGMSASTARVHAMQGREALRDAVLGSAGDVHATGRPPGRGNHGLS